MVQLQITVANYSCCIIALHYNSFSKNVKMAARRLSHDDRVKIVILREEGYSMKAIASRMKAIASRMKCSHSAVSKTLKRVKESGSVND